MIFSNIANIRKIRRTRANANARKNRQFWSRSGARKHVKRVQFEKMWHSEKTTLCIAKISIEAAENGSSKIWVSCQILTPLPGSDKLPCSRCPLISHALSPCGLCVWRPAPASPTAEASIRYYIIRSPYLTLCCTHVHEVMTDQVLSLSENNTSVAN